MTVGKLFQNQNLVNRDSTKAKGNRDCTRTDEGQGHIGQGHIRVKDTFRSRLQSPGRNHKQLEIAQNYTDKPHASTS